MSKFFYATMFSTLLKREILSFIEIFHIFDIFKIVCSRFFFNWGRVKKIKIKIKVFRIHYLEQELHLISTNTAMMKNRKPSPPITIRFQAIMSNVNGLSYTSVLNLANIEVLISLAMRSNNPAASAYWGNTSNTFFAVSMLSLNCWKKGNTFFLKIFSNHIII